MINEVDAVREVRMRAGIQLPIGVTEMEIEEKYETQWKSDDEAECLNFCLLKFAQSWIMWLKDLLFTWKPLTHSQLTADLFIGTEQVQQQQ